MKKFITLFAMCLTFSVLALCFSGCSFNNHTHSYTTTVIAPTCTEDGYTEYVCECGDKYKDNVVEATGHNFVDGVCSVCNAKDDDTPTPPPVDEFKVDDIVFGQTNFIYQAGKVYSITIKSIPSGVTYVVNNNEQSEVGTYKVTFKFYIGEKLVGTKDMTMVIEEKSQVELPWA